MLNQQDAQTCSLGIYIALSNPALLRVSARKEPS